MIDEFLLFHKRGCLANKGQDCNCGLFVARAEWESIKAAQQSMKANECQEPCELGGIHEFAEPVQICSKCGTRRLC